MKQKYNQGKLLLSTHLTEKGFRFRTEYRFHPKRMWRFDFCLPDYMVAIEIEGGTWIQGRHNTGSGMQGDIEKYNEAVRAGWRLLRFTTADVMSGNAIEFIDSWLKPRGVRPPGEKGVRG